MRRIGLLLTALTLWLTAGCTNLLYQGELTALDSSGNERHFILYWTKSDPLVGAAKAGPAILLTECSPFTRISFDEQPDGLIFRGAPGEDRLPGDNPSIVTDLTCGKVATYSRWVDAREGALSLAILCQPINSDFQLQPRNYLKARGESYTFSIVQQVRKWSFFGETLPGPAIPECRKGAEHDKP